MKRRRTPREDKARDYDRRRRVLRYKGSRRARPWFVARSARIYRHNARLLLAVEQVAADEIEIKRHLPVRRDRGWRHTQAIALRERLKWKQHARASRMLMSFLATPYEPQRHTARFAAMLTQVTSGTKPVAKEFAAAFRAILSAPRPRDFHWFGDDTCDTPGWCTMAVDTRYLNWLRAFFRDEPEWEPRLRAWIASVLD